MSIAPVRLNHAVLFVAELARAEQFYTEVFDMVVSARVPQMNAAFLRLARSENDHDLGLFGVGRNAAPRRRGGIGLYHLAWQVDTVDELEDARRTLIAAQAHTGDSSHGPTKSVYGVDPDGNEFEVMWMVPREEWGKYENSAGVDRLDLGAEMARWSGVGTAGRLVRGSAWGSEAGDEVGSVGNVAGPRA